jgi:6-phosphofructokinase
MPRGDAKHPDNNRIDRVVEHLEGLEAEYVVDTGGDDGALIAAKLARALKAAGIKIIHVPKTIDIDPYTDTEFDGSMVSDTPGARSAIYNIASPSLKGVKEEALDMARVFNVGVMGRDCGELSLGVAYKIGADYCLIPEVPMTRERILRLYEKLRPGDVVVVSEGATWWNPNERKCTGFYQYTKNEKGEIVPVIDTHGRKRLGNAHEGVAEAIKNEAKIDTRSHPTGYLGRTGPPHEGDIEYERVLGEMVKKIVDAGMTAVMPSPKIVVPYRRMKDNMHIVNLPKAGEMEYEKIKEMLIQPFDVNRFYDEDNFRWTPDFERLVNTMLAAE